MKRLITLCYLCFYVANSAAREVELVSTYYIPFEPYIINITLPDKSFLSLDDFPVEVLAPVVEINKKIPELILPPRGKGIDVSGVYQCKEDNSLFSVHHYDDRLILINISRNINFLKDIGIISKTEIQNDFTHPIEKFTFIFDKEFIRNMYTSSHIPSIVNLLNFNFFKNNSSDISYAVKAKYGVPLIPTDAYLHNAQITSLFADLHLSFGYSTQTQQMSMDIWKDNGSMAYNPRKGCLRIF